MKKKNKSTKKQTTEILSPENAVLPSLGPQLHIENHVTNLGSLLRPSKAAVEKAPLCFHACCLGNSEKKWAETPARLRFLETYVTTGRAGWKVTKMGLLASGAACREVVVLDPGGSWGIQGDIYEAHHCPKEAGS